VSRRVEPEKDWALLLLALVALAIAAVVFGWQRAEAGPYTRIFEATAEVGDMSEWDFVVETGGATIAASGDSANSIGKGFKCSVVNANKECRAIKAYTASRFLHARGYFNTGNLNMTGGAATAHFWTMYRNGGMNKVQLNLKDLGTTFGVGVLIQDDTRLITPAIEYVDTIAGGEWFEVRVDADQVAGPDGVIVVTIDDRVVWSADTLDLDATLIDSLRVGLSTGPLQTNTGSGYFDDVVIDTMACLACSVPPVRAEYGFSSPFGGF